MFGHELCWVSRIAMIITGEHTFTLSSAGRGRGLSRPLRSAACSAGSLNPAFANAESSFEALNQALRARA
jgi:hypothetical protein